MVRCGGWCAAPVAATVLKRVWRSWSDNPHEGIERVVTQRAVAIPALGWRLRADFLAPVASGI
jgi:hypothetical protein